MKKVLEAFKQHKKLIVLATLLILLIGVATALYSGKNKTKISASAGGSNENEVKLCNILSGIDGVGKSEVMITEEGGKIVGVIVVCEGANSISTRIDIINAIKTAFNIEKSNIAIYAMK